MCPFKSMMVGLSLDDSDDAVIRFSSEIARHAAIAKATFLHVATNLDVPRYIGDKYPILLQSGDEFAKNKMSDRVHNCFDSSLGVRVEFETVEGTPLLELLRRVSYKNIDLIVLGKLKEPAAGGTLGLKVARKAPCSVFVVPENTPPKFESIMVPADFVESSLRALEVAVAIAASAKIAEVTCVHAYRVPSGYYKTGKTYEQFAEIMRGHAEEKYNEFVARVDIPDGVTVKPLFKLYNKVHQTIREISRDHPVDLLVIGARGRKSDAGSLLGSVTEQLIRKTKIPLLAVKKKGEGMSFLKSLLDI